MSLKTRYYPGLFLLHTDADGNKPEIRYILSCVVTTSYIEVGTLQLNDEEPEASISNRLSTRRIHLVLHPLRIRFSMALVVKTP